MDPLVLAEPMRLLLWTNGSGGSGAPARLSLRANSSMRRAARAPAMPWSADRCELGAGGGRRRVGQPHHSERQAEAQDREGERDEQGDLERLRACLVVDAQDFLLGRFR